MRRLLKGFQAPRAAGLEPAPEDASAAPSFLSSLRVRLMGLVLLVLLPSFALVLYTQSDERRAATANVHRDASRLIRIVTSNQAAQVEATRQLLTALERLPQVRSGDGPACSALLAGLLKAYPLYLNFGVIDRSGKVICSAVPLSAEVNVADRDYFVRAMTSGHFVMGDYQIGRIIHLPSINYALPMVDDEGKPQAVMYAAQSLSWLTAALTDVPLPPDALLVVTDRRGIVLARIPQLEGGVGAPLAEKDVLATLSAQRDGGVFESDDAKGMPRLWAHAPLGPGLDVHAIIGVPLEVAFADVDRRFTRNLGALAIVTLVALLAAWFGGKLMLRQVGALVAVTRRLAGGHFGTRAPSTDGRSELDVLARAFNRMASMLQTRDRALRDAEEKTRAAEVELAVTRAHLDIARQIQQSLLPQAPLALDGAQFAGRCIPAVAVGGDYFGYFPSEHGRVDTFVGDVSGHGVGAALLMAEARTTFLAERLAASGASSLLGKLNALLHDDLDRAGLFMTACCSTFDTRTRVLAYANAGHPPALLLRAHDARCVPIDANGVLLGVDRNARFAEARLTLAAGDIAVFYTDGITETQDPAGELFGIERLGEAVVAHRNRDAEGVIDGVLAAVDRFAGATEHEDDVTIVVMKLAA
jgi:serine phosphatase RsbU (regulator of sigma subunit)